jgi:hypothetical protein
VAVDSEIARTLVELERKLEELERALTSIGAQRREGAPGYGGGARLIDESLDVQAGAAPSPQGAVPAGGRPPGDFDESIELAELVRFRDRLERTMRELVEGYEQVIRLRGASSPRPPIGES